MTTAQWGTMLIYFAAPPATLFAIVYTFTARWYRTLAGAAVMSTVFGLAVLVDNALLFHVVGPDYPYHASIVLTCFGLLGLGMWLYLGLLVREQIVRRHRRRAQ